MFLVVGLGNPGKEYASTRHNAGFLSLDYCAAQLDCACTQEKWQGVYGRCQLDGQALLLLKPQTFMNRSGLCVARFVEYFSVEPTRILVLHDDLDMPCGRIKIVARGGAGGHNGIRSLMDHLGDDEFARIKIGIGRPGSGDSSPRMPVERYVLQAFSPAEWTEIRDRFELVWEGVRLFVRQGVAMAMNRVNSSGQIGRLPAVLD
ncbi:MAG: aminoacyl-tRNA hydrolase [Desulfobulbaceae bacterium A2]|nr:MAG: aminoacyl-tRNA hydrolase [Desulfobulbaceae bacterium A2]